MPLSSARRLVYAFFELPWHRREAIAKRLGVLEDKDQHFVDKLRYALVFKRAKERGLNEELKAAIATETEAVRLRRRGAV